MLLPHPHVTLARLRALAAFLFALTWASVFVVTVLLGLTRCQQAKDPANWPNTTRAAAAASLDFATCTETGLQKLAEGGASSFTQNAVLTVGETCGIADIIDGLAIFVGVVRDVAAMVKHGSSPPPPAPITDTQPDGGT